MANEELEALRKEAKDLNIDFKLNDGVAKLQSKIDAYYESQETSSDELEEMVKAVEQAEEKPVVKSKETVTEVYTPKPMAQIARELYKEATKLVVVTIIDNDQRVNNQTTTVPVNWSNQFYDLGTMSFPLNVPIEIQQGFINVLKECMIPHHVKDPKTQLSTTIMRQRYTIAYEQIQK